MGDDAEVQRQAANGDGGGALRFTGEVGDVDGWVPSDSVMRIGHSRRTREPGSGSWREDAARGTPAE